MTNLKGINLAMQTPFTDSGRVDYYFDGKSLSNYTWRRVYMDWYWVLAPDSTLT